MERIVRAPTAVTQATDVLATLRSVDETATLVYNLIDKALETTTEHVERQVGALKDLCKGLENLKSNTMPYNILLGAAQKDARLSVKGLDGVEGMDSFKKALVATQQMLMRPKGALRFVLNVLRANLWQGDLQSLIGDLEGVTKEVFVCQQNNERAFKPLWYRYVAKQQSTVRTSSVDNIGDTQDRVWLALDSVLDAFRVHPFAISPAKIRRANNLHIFAILNHNHEAVTRHQKLARQIGNAWVDDSARGYINDSKVQDFGVSKTSLFDLLWSGLVEQLKPGSPYSSDSPEQPKFESTVGELERVLKKEIVRSRQQRFTIAFCGTVEADKSLFLNALIGHSILPSDALPCRFRHVAGQLSPVLQFHAEPFLAALKKLQDRQYGRKMQTYQPPPENMFEELPLSDLLSDPSNEEILLRTIHGQWVNLHAVTRDNLLKFETPEFKLPREADGDLNVKILLDQLNDIVRLCQQFDLGFEMSEGNWPLLTVEFSSLRDHQMDGIYEFIDLPVIGEGFYSANFESLARLVASDSNAIVPIVSFKDIPHSDWKWLPELVVSGFNRTADVVVCTHLDPVSQENMDEQLKPVKEAFWPGGVLSTNRVIPCSLMGISARYLLDSTTKPPFEDIWNKSSIGYHCATKILGAEDPLATYNRFDNQTWRDRLQAELPAGGLSGDIQRLTKEVVDSARATALLNEVDTVTRQLREMRIVYEQKLLIEATRIEAEYEAAKMRCDEAPGISQAVLETLGRVESIQAQEVRSLLEEKLELISQKASGFINQTITKTLADSSMSLKDMDVGQGTRGASSGKRGFGNIKWGNGDINDKLQESSSAESRQGNVLVAENRPQARDFLQLCQRELNSALEMLKKECAAIILDLVGIENAKLLKAVRGLIKQAEVDPITQHWENRIRALAPPPLNIDEFVFQESRVINSRQIALFSFSREYSIEMDALQERFKDDIVDPWIRKLKEEGEIALFGTIGKSFTSAKDRMTSALREKELRCKRELKKREVLDGEEAVERLTAVYSNLLAAEEALGELFARVEAL